MAKKKSKSIRPSIASGKPKDHSSKKAALGPMNFGWNTTSGIGNINTSAYRNSYSNMGISAGNCGDIPQYFLIMNENNGGIFYWPVTLKEKYEFYRYFARTDPFVKRAVEYHTDLPMSKLMLRMPKMKDEKKRDMILRKYEHMMKRVRLSDKLHSMLYEKNVLGNAFIFCEFDEENKEWGKLVILPPEEIIISRYPMSDQAKVMYQPEILNQIMRRYSVPVDSYERYVEWLDSLDQSERAVMQNVPYELTKQIIENRGVLVMDTDPFSGDEGHKVGSFVYHFSDKRHDYYDLGVSPLECVLNSLIIKEHLKYTQISLSSRNMTPRNKITAPDIGDEALMDLRNEVDLSMQNPDYSIVTNYDFQWEVIGAENRLIDLSREYETIENQMIAGLGVTRELLTGEGMYSGSKISAELMNTRYLIERERIISFIENSLFLPMAEENGFYEIDEWGNKTYFYPRVSFTRLSIRDNAEVFDSLYQLYQKGSLPIDPILELFNLDSDEVHEKLKRDQFTIKDSTYNEMMRGIYSSAADQVLEKSDLVNQIINYMTGPNGEPLKNTEDVEEESDEDMISETDDLNLSNDDADNEEQKHSEAEHENESIEESEDNVSEIEAPSDIQQTNDFKQNIKVNTQDNEGKEQIDVSEIEDRPPEMKVKHQENVEEIL